MTGKHPENDSTSPNQDENMGDLAAEVTRILRMQSASPLMLVTNNTESGDEPVQVAPENDPSPTALLEDFNIHCGENPVTYQPRVGRFAKPTFPVVTSQEAYVKPDSTTATDEPYLAEAMHNFVVEKSRHLIDAYNLANQAIPQAQVLPQQVSKHLHHYYEDFPVKNGNQDRITEKNRAKYLAAHETKAQEVSGTFPEIRLVKSLRKILTDEGNVVAANAASALLAAYGRRFENIASGGIQAYETPVNYGGIKHDLRLIDDD